MLPRNDPDRIQIAFDDHRLVNNAGLILRPRWLCIWACPNWLIGTWTWAVLQVEPTPAIR